MTLVLRFWTKKIFIDEVRTGFNTQHYIKVLEAKNTNIKYNGYDIRK